MLHGILAIRNISHVLQLMSHWLISGQMYNKYPGHLVYLDSACRDVHNLTSIVGFRIRSTI